LANEIDVRIFYHLWVAFSETIKFRRLNKRHGFGSLENCNFREIFRLIFHTVMIFERDSIRQGRDSG
jgi:hypothetical protein